MTKLISCHGDLLAFLSDYISGRFEGYVQLVFDIHNFIVCTYIAYQKIRQSIKKVSAKQSLITIKPATYPAVDHPLATQLSIVPTHQLISNYLCGKSPILYGLARIVTTISFAATRGCRAGMP